MRNALLLTTLLATLAPAAGAETTPMHRTVETMRAADDSVCNLLRAQAGDRCTALLTDGAATIYRSGTARGVNRVVLALTIGGRTMVGPSIDMVGVDAASGASITAITPTVRDIALDGKPAIAVEVTTTFGTAFETHDAIACAATDRGAWRCAHVDAGRCAIAIGDGGAVTSTCGNASLSLAAH